LQHPRPPTDAMTEPAQHLLLALFCTFRKRSEHLFVNLPSVGAQRRDCGRDWWKDLWKDLALAVRPKAGEVISASLSPFDKSEWDRPVEADKLKRSPARTLFCCLRNQERIYASPPPSFPSPVCPTSSPRSNVRRYRTPSLFLHPFASLFPYKRISSCRIIASAARQKRERGTLL
jgi:hypothetical protein